MSVNEYLNKISLNECYAIILEHVHGVLNCGSKMLSNRSCLI